MPMATSSKHSQEITTGAEKFIWKTGDVGTQERPSPREGHCSCVVGSSLYVFGGVSISPDDNVDEKGDLWKFDMADKQWTLVTYSAESEKPLTRSAATMVSVNNKIYLFGGLNHSVGWLDDLLVFDIETSCWTEEDEFTGNAPSSRDKLCSAVIGQNIWFFGGFGPQANARGLLDLEDEENAGSSDDEINQLESQQQAAQFGWFDDLHVYDTRTKTWSQPVQLSMGKPSPRCAASMIAHNKTLVIFGGRDAEGRVNDIHFFNTDIKKWVKDREVKGTPPDPRSFHAAVLYDSNTMLVTGGRGLDNQHYNDIYTFNLDNTTWTRLDGAGFSGRGCHTMNTINHDMVVFGGSGSFNQTLQHCETFHGDLLVAKLSSKGDASDGSPSKIKRTE